MRLDIEFIISTLILIAFLIPLYIQRKKIVQFIQKKSSSKSLIHDIKIYFQITHPLIKLDYSIIDKTKNESNSDVRDIQIIEELVSQYAHADVKIDTPPTVKKELLWANYELTSMPQKEKMPKDMPMRKELVFRRDQAKCKRCGQSVKLNHSYLHFLRDLTQGGTYHLENLVTVCSDCNKILKSSNLAKTIEALDTYEHLISKIHD